MESLDVQHQMMGYDRAATMFSPDGHILQVEYAEKTVRLGSASIGFICSDGVVFVTDRRLVDDLIVDESTNKIFEIDEHIIGVSAGIPSDARILAERAQLIAQQNRVTYDSPIDTLSVVKDISNIKQQYTQHPGVRPFGVTVMVAGIDNRKRLYVSEITGNYIEYYATAIGENDDKIKDLLRKKYKKDITVDQAIKLGLSIFKEVLGSSYNIERFEVAYIHDKTKKIQKVETENLKKYLK